MIRIAPRVWVADEAGPLEPPSLRRSRSSNLINQLIKLSFHRGHRISVTVFELTKRLVKTKPLCEAIRAKHHGHRIECTVAAEVTKYENSQSVPPSTALRPVEDNRPLTQPGQHVLLDVVVPNRTVGIDEQDVTATHTPTAPDGDVQEQAGKQMKCEREDKERQDDYEQRQSGRSGEPSQSFCALIAHGVVDWPNY